MSSAKWQAAKSDLQTASSDLVEWKSPATVLFLAAAATKTREHRTVWTTRGHNEHIMTHIWNGYRHKPAAAQFHNFNSIHFMICLSLEFLACANYPSFMFWYVLGKVWLRRPFDSMVQFIETIHPMILAVLSLLALDLEPNSTNMSLFWLKHILWILCPFLFQLGQFL
jgi:hypothetical protein